MAELQNQDPMEPMKNSELLQQVSQIRAIQSNDRLTDTLESVSLGQNLATAGNLLDRARSRGWTTTATGSRGRWTG